MITVSFWPITSLDTNQCKGLTERSVERVCLVKRQGRDYVVGWASSEALVDVRYKLGDERLHLKPWSLGLSNVNMNWKEKVTDSSAVLRYLHHLSSNWTSPNKYFMTTSLLFHSVQVEAKSLIVNAEWRINGECTGAQRRWISSDWCEYGRPPFCSVVSDSTDLN